MTTDVDDSQPPHETPPERAGGKSRKGAPVETPHFLLQPDLAAALRELFAEREREGLSLDAAQVAQLRQVAAALLLVARLGAVAEESAARAKESAAKERQLESLKQRLAEAETQRDAAHEDATQARAEAADAAARSLPAWQALWPRGEPEPARPALTQHYALLAVERLAEELRERGLWDDSCWLVSLHERLSADPESGADTASLRALSIEMLRSNRLDLSGPLLGVAVALERLHEARSLAVAIDAASRAAALLEYRRTESPTAAEAARLEVLRAGTRDLWSAS